MWYALGLVFVLTGLMTDLGGSFWEHVIYLNAYGKASRRAEPGNRD
jgi:uncharacterized protein YjeT (DUF2065 family)